MTYCYRTLLCAAPFGSACGRSRDEGGAWTFQGWMSTGGDVGKNAACFEDIAARLNSIIRTVTPRRVDGIGIAL